MHDVTNTPCTGVVRDHINFSSAVFNLLQSQFTAMHSTASKPKDASNGSSVLETINGRNHATKPVPARMSGRKTLTKTAPVRVTKVKSRQSKRLHDDDTERNSL